MLQGNEEENYRDVPVNEMEGDDGGGVEGVMRGEEVVENGVRESVEGGGEEEGGGRVVGVERIARDNGYNMSHRNPQFSGAESSCLWELKELCLHYHPSVQLFAKKLASVTESRV